MRNIIVSNVYYLLVTNIINILYIKSLDIEYHLSLIQIFVICNTLLIIYTSILNIRIYVRSLIKDEV